MPLYVEPALELRVKTGACKFDIRHKYDVFPALAEMRECKKNCEKLREYKDRKCKNVGIQKCKNAGMP